MNGSRAYGAEAQESSDIEIAPQAALDTARTRPRLGGGGTATTRCQWGCQWRRCTPNAHTYGLEGCRRHLCRVTDAPPAPPSSWSCRTTGTSGAPAAGPTTLLAQAWGLWCSGVLLGTQMGGMTH